MTGHSPSVGHLPAGDAAHPSEPSSPAAPSLSGGFVAVTSEPNRAGCTDMGDDAAHKSMNITTCGQWAGVHVLLEVVMTVEGRAVGIHSVTIVDANWRYLEAALAKAAFAIETSLAQGRSLVDQFRGAMHGGIFDFIVSAMLDVELSAATAVREVLGREVLGAP